MVENERVRIVERTHEMNITEEQGKSLEWVEKCIEGRRRGDGELNHLKNLLTIIDAQQKEIVLLIAKEGNK